MTLQLNTVKCSRFMSSAFCRWYHPSPLLLRWPSQLKAYKEKKLQKKVKIWEGMSIWDLAKSMKKDLGYVNDVLKPLLSTKVDNVSGRIEDLYSIKCLLEKEKLDYSVIKVQNKRIDINGEKPKLVKTSTTTKTEFKRPPVVTIMGHVDHGKTTLLDALRNSNIVAKEFGGITQHIGAFSVTLGPGKTVTFIDTPGHAAFSAMRNRGAEVTDIVVLIVAADDGVMEQTIESIHMAKNAGVKIIVAVNKIDKGGNTMGIIKEQLLKEGVQAEDFGGDVQFIPISALKRINLNLLVEAILIEAEMMGLSGDPNSPVEGVIIEASIGSRGRVATVLVTRGTLRKRVMLLAGTAFARVRGMYDENGRELSEVTLSQPAQVIGWQDLPNAGDNVIEVASQKEGNLLIQEEKKKLLRQKMLKSYVSIQEKSVQEKAEFTERKNELNLLRTNRDIEGLKKFFAAKPKIVGDDGPKLNIIVKGDVDGSVDAILDILSTYKQDKECKLNLVHFGVGEVTKSDLDLAETFNATIYCFNLNFPQSLKQEIAAKGISIRFHNVIYKFIDDLKKELSEKIPVVEENDTVGTGEVLQNFFLNEGRKMKPVAGSVCLTGEFRMKMIYRVIRKGETIFEGPIRSLKHFKNEVSSIKKGSQCGIMLEDFPGEFKQGDKIICLEKKLVQYQTSWDPGF